MVIARRRAQPGGPSLSSRRRKEWFDDDSFGRELFPFMFPEERFAAADDQVGQVLKLTTSPGKRALDLCCGPGRCTIALARRGFSVTGVDRTAFLPGGGRLAPRHEIFDDWTRIRNERILVRRGRTRTWSFHHTMYSGQDSRERTDGAGFADVRLYGPWTAALMARRPSG